VEFGRGGALACRISRARAGHQSISFQHPLATSTTTLSSPNATQKSTCCHSVELPSPPGSTDAAALIVISSSVAPLQAQPPLASSYGYAYPGHGHRRAAQNGQHHKTAAQWWTHDARVVLFIQAAHPSRNPDASPARMESSTPRRTCTRPGLSCSPSFCSHAYSTAATVRSQVLFLRTTQGSESSNAHKCDPELLRRHASY
jgi:hypothetical protein